MEILFNFSPTVQIYSIDEAFVDLSGTKRLYKKNYYKIAQDIKDRIKKDVGIDVSIGLSGTKVLSKLANDKVKKYFGGGIYMIGERKIQKELKRTPLNEIWGIGKNLTKTYARWGILYADELVQKSDSWLKSNIGVVGLELKHELLGDIISPVENKVEMPKSIQKTQSFSEFTQDINFIKNELNYHIHTACTKLRKCGGKTRLIGVMLRTKDFQILYIKKKIDIPTNFELEITKIAHPLLDELFQKDILYRSCGIILENISNDIEFQTNLFSEKNINSEKHDRLAKCIDKIKEKFGHDKIKTGYYK